MDSKVKRVTLFVNRKGGINMEKSEFEKKQAEKKAEENRRLKRGMKLLAVVGVGAGLYGFKLGRRSGYAQGVKDGYFTMGQEMLQAWKEHTEELKLTRGE